ncbi:MAG TPA: glutamate-cysteine ligase family protein [Blastocatellia bacterium]|nr:glutamate-cysteine ligase family protein [Blastocatellia bacterium]
MGEQNVSADHNEHETKVFMKALLSDLTALEKVIEAGRIESGVRRIGAEQEMFLVDSAMRPKSIAPELLAAVTDTRLTTETGKFNLEANLSPQLFTDRCLHDMEQEALALVGLAQWAAQKLGGDVLLTGILPTLRQADLTLENLTPGVRYYELNRVIQQLRGGSNMVYIKGLDELNLKHDNMMLEACCTSFQAHYQVGAEEFVALHNLAQVITAPLLAVAANSPLLLGHRLWHETRIPLFQHSVDERSQLRQYRGHPPRVSFGDAWVKDSILEIFREEIARFRVVLTKKIEEDSLAVVARGELPQLAALRLHNGTIWRWNRPCYGVADGVAHLRIENRVMPAGPSILDEMANAAFFFGLMTALPDEYGDVTRLMSFDDAKGNFLAAARHSLQAQFTWLKGKSIPASTLISEHLLPLARAGLQHANLASEDIRRYLDVIEARVQRNQNGALWALRSLAALEGQGTREQRYQALAAETLAQQQTNTPVHGWGLATLAQTAGTPSWSQNFQTVGQFMSTDLFTVRPDDLVDLAACVMDWRHVRHVPVEDDEGRLVGLVSHRDLLHLMAQGLGNHAAEPVAVKEIMTSDLVTITPQTSTLAAIELMRLHKVGCLPVLEEERLVGIITAYDFLTLSAELIEAHLKPSGPK